MSVSVLDKWLAKRNIVSSSKALNDCSTVAGIAVPNHSCVSGMLFYTHSVPFFRALHSVVC